MLRARVFRPFTTHLPKCLANFDGKSTSSILKHQARPFSSRTSNDANPYVIKLVIHGEGKGVHQKHVTAGPSPDDKVHTIQTDGLKGMGGADQAACPAFHALASLTSCAQVTASLVAKDLGIRLGEWKFDVSGDLDVRVLVGGADGNANFHRVAVRARVQTDADAEQFARLVAETERRCPITQLFKRSGLELDSKWEALPLKAAA
jgi:putative redox protein